MTRRVARDRDWAVLALIAVLAVMLVTSSIQDVILGRQQDEIRFYREQLKKCSPLMQEVKSR